MTDKPKSFLLIVIEYVPLITGIIVAFGCLRLIAYYSVFNLSIFNYTDLSDFVSQGIIDISSIVVYTLFGLAMPKLKKNPFKSELENGIINNEIIEANSKKFLTFFEYLAYMAIIFILIYSGVNYIRKRTFEKYDQLYLFSGICYAFGLFLCIQLGKMYLDFNKKRINKGILIFIVILSFYFVGSLWSNYTTALSVKYRQENIGEAITVNKENLVSDKNYYYIGQTKSYVFFHNQITNTNDIFPKSEISKMTLSH